LLHCVFVALWLQTVSLEAKGSSSGASRSDRIRRVFDRGGSGATGISDAASSDSQDSEEQGQDEAIEEEPESNTGSPFGLPDRGSLAQRRLSIAAANAYIRVADGWIQGVELCVGEDPPDSIPSVSGVVLSSEAFAGAMHAGSVAGTCEEINQDLGHYLDLLDGKLRAAEGLADQAERVESQ
jgi:hypothetical protein